MKNVVNPLWPWAYATTVNPPSVNLQSIPVLCFSLLSSAIFQFFIFSGFVQTQKCRSPCCTGWNEVDEELANFTHSRPVADLNASSRHTNWTDPVTRPVHVRQRHDYTSYWLRCGETRAVGAGSVLNTSTPMRLFTLQFANWSWVQLSLFDVLWTSVYSLCRTAALLVNESQTCQSPDSIAPQPRQKRYAACNHAWQLTRKAGIQHMVAR